VNACPNCSSDRIRRGGMAIWLTYIALIIFAIVAVLIFKLNAAIVAGIMIAVVVIAHLVFNQRVCLDCGTQWSPRRNV
jgi:predicted lysophospholipase L1 biosynthesis ABC-type transport system permease subunit